MPHTLQEEGNVVSALTESIPAPGEREKHLTFAHMILPATGKGFCMFLFNCSAPMAGKQKPILYKGPTGTGGDDINLAFWRHPFQICTLMVRPQWTTFILSQLQLVWERRPFMEENLASISIDDVCLWQSGNLKQFTLSITPHTTTVSLAMKLSHFFPILWWRGKGTSGFTSGIQLRELPAPLSSRKRSMGGGTWTQTFSFYRNTWLHITVRLPTNAPRNPTLFLYRKPSFGHDCTTLPSKL